MKILIPEKGGIVQSTQGRDKGRLYAVCEVLADGFILVTDGETRKLFRPKRKNLKHVRPLPHNVGEDGITFPPDKAFDDRVAHYLKGLQKAIKSKSEDSSFV